MWIRDVKRGFPCSSKNARPKKTDWLSREHRANLYWTHRAFQDLRALDRLSTGKRMKKKTQALKRNLRHQPEA